MRQKFSDEGYYYRVYTGMLRYDYITKEFINLDNAKAFLISLIVDQKATT